MHICLYNPVNLRYSGGGEKWIIEVAQRLQEIDHKVTIITTRWSPSITHKSIALPSDIDILEVRYLHFLSGFAFPSALDLKMFVDEVNKADVVYFYVYPPNELLAWLLKTKIHTPFVGGFHTFLDPQQFKIHYLYQPLFRKALSAFCGLHVLNSYLGNLMQDWGYNNCYFKSCRTLIWIILIIIFRNILMNNRSFL